jgi:hypothetical protein
MRSRADYDAGRPVMTTISVVWHRATVEVRMEAVNERATTAVEGSIPSSLTTLRRDDLAACLSACRAACRAPAEWRIMGLGVAGFAVGPLLMQLRNYAGLPPALDPVALVIGWTIVLGMFAISLRRMRRIIARHQIACPACAHPMLDSAVLRRVDSAADKAVATGRCPHCGAHSFAA